MRGSFDLYFKTCDSVQREKIMSIEGTYSDWARKNQYTIIEKWLCYLQTVKKT